MNDNTPFDEQMRYYMHEASEGEKVLWMAGVKLEAIDRLKDCPPPMDVYALVRALHSPVSFPPDTRSKVRKVLDRLDVWWFNAQYVFGEWRWRLVRWLTRGRIV